MQKSRFFPKFIDENGCGIAHRKEYEKSRNCVSGGGYDFCSHAEIVAEKGVDEPHVRALSSEGGQTFFEKVQSANGVDACER